MPLAAHTRPLQAWVEFDGASYQAGFSAREVPAPRCDPAQASAECQRADTRHVRSVGDAYFVLGDRVNLSSPILRTSAGVGTIHVVDGDTIRSEGNLYRLVGLNAPESGLNARCERERALAAEATQRLYQLVESGDADLQPLPCACPRGTEGTERCNYGRLCATLRVEGRDVGAILIAEGLAERYNCWATSCPQRKNWCAS